MKPYSALFGTLKVADEVEVAIDAGLSATPDPRRSGRSVAVDRLGVEAALDAGRQRPGAVGVHGQVGDRPRLRSASCRRRRTRRPASCSASGGASSAIPASSWALARIFSVALLIAAGVPPDGLVLKPWPSPKRSVSAGTTLMSSAGHAELVGHQPRVLGLVAVGLGGQAEHHLAGRVHPQEHRSVCLIRHRLAPPVLVCTDCTFPAPGRASRASRWRSWWAVSTLCSSESQKLGCGPPSRCGGIAGRSHPG